MRNRKASAPQANGDAIDLIKAEHMEKEKLAVLLFHRGSPNAADPAYRKRVKDQITIRQTRKANDEEQAVSCHLTISTIPRSDGKYAAALEEIPGLSGSAVMSILGSILRDYSYIYDDKGEDAETYSVLKVEGVKSESLTNALKSRGSLDYLTLTRTLPPDAPDSQGIAEPQSQKVKYKIVGNPASAPWRKRFKDFVEGVKPTWDYVSVDVTLDDNRHKTVRVDTQDDAAELLFIRSELVHIQTDLNPCTLEIVPQVVKAASKLMRKK
jgi:hypothetical protein